MKVDLDAKLLAGFLEKQGEFISGGALAKRFDISRVSIWSHLGKLRKSGFEFDAVQNRGYALSSVPDILQVNLLKAYLKRSGCEMPLFFYNVVDSTNTEAERQMAAGIEVPFAVVAKEMTAGRGRLGRPWQSDNPGSLYLTFGFRPRLAPQAMQCFSLWMGVDFCRFIKNYTGLDVSIKWPNDIVIQGKKIAGMLAEARINADYTRDMIFGVGINVNGPLSRFPKELQGKATTLEVESGQFFPLNHFAASFIKCGHDAYQAFVKTPNPVDLFDLWDEYDFLRGKKITAKTYSDSFTGTASGIDENGHLLLDLGGGSIKKLSAADVSLSSTYQE